MCAPMYTLIGQEYHSLYISTCEPTWEDGNTRNPTKSICDPFVFNTAITRAKSLIVSFGNPFLLLATEKHMVQKYGSTGKCWSEYMMRCLLNGTFIVPDSVIKSLSDKGKYKQKLMQTLEGCGSDKGIHYVNFVHKKYIRIYVDIPAKNSISCIVIMLSKVTP